jgi:hypothetical protein
VTRVQDLNQNGKDGHGRSAKAHDLCHFESNAGKAQAQAQAQQDKNSRMLRFAQARRRVRQNRLASNAMHSKVAGRSLHRW